MSIIFRKLIIKFIYLYKTIISSFLGKNCRYYPSCSDYTIQSIEKYGIIKGIGKGILRILRCNQFFKGGYDPVE